MTRHRIKMILCGVCCLVWIYLHGCTTKPPSRPDSPPPPSPAHTKPYKVKGRWYTPLPHAKDFKQRGIASWYGKKFHGRKTASGETYNMYGISAAHKTLPLGTVVRVRNLKNGNTIEVRINDRGPFVKGRIIDLSRGAAKKLAILQAGTAPVEIEALGYVQTPPRRGRSAPPARNVDYHTGNFTFQVGAFKDRRNADRLRAKLDPLFKNAHVTVYDAGSEVYYRVRVGRSHNLIEARKYEEYLTRNGYPDAFVIAE